MSPSGMTTFYRVRFFSIFLIIALIAPLFPDRTLATAIGKGGVRGPQEKRIAKISEKAEYASGEIVVRFVADVRGDTSKVTAFAKNKHLEKKASFDAGKAVVFKIKDGQSVKNKTAELISDSSVLVAQPNFQYKPLVISTNDTNKADLWGLDNTGQAVNGISGTADADIDAPEAWAIDEGTNGEVTVAVIDDGVAYNHPDLAANMWDGSSCVDENGDAILGGCLHGYDFESLDNDPLPDSATHGTFVAGIIAAAKNNAKGLIGVAPNAKIMALKSSLTTEEIVNAVAFAENNGAKVINASWGGYGDDPILDDAIANFDGLFVAAAGNESVDNDGEDPLYPCALTTQVSNMICVAATDQNDALADFSNYGATTVDVAAPGVNIFSIDAYTNALNEDFQGVTVPDVPGTWTKSGNFGSINDGGDKKLVGDTNQSPYLDNANNTTTTASYDTTASRDGQVLTDFDTSCDTEYSDLWTDYVEMDSSNDGGTNWSLADMRWDEMLIDNDVDPTGSASYQVVDNVLGVASSASTKLRFKWITNGNADANHSGCTINNLKIKYLADGAGEGYEFMDGTSMATPMVAGAVALAWGYRPTLTASAIKAAAVDQGDVIVGLDGMVSSGKRLNVKNTLQYLQSAKTIDDLWFDEARSAYPVIDDGAGTIDITVAAGTDVTALTPNLTHEGASISPLSGSVQDFTNPVTYTVTALDSSTKDYVVTVAIAIKPTISNFEFSDIVSHATIDNINNTVDITVPYGTNRATLQPIITHTAESIDLAFGFEQDYTNPVEYVLLDADGLATTYTVTVTVGENPFSDTGVSFGKGDVHMGKTSSLKVKVNFDDVDNAAFYMVSRNKDFDGADWKDGKNGVKLSLKKKSGKQKFYFRFKDADGVISDIYTKTVTYVPALRTVKNSQSRIKRGGILVQSGKRFSKNASVDLYFLATNGSYKKLNLPTDAQGNFSVSFRVNKPSGKYDWYAVDVKTGKKSKSKSYTVTE